MITNYYRKTIKLKKNMNDKNANIEIDTNYNGNHKHYKHQINNKNLPKILNVIDNSFTDIPKSIGNLNGCNIDNNFPLLITTNSLIKNTTKRRNSKITKRKIIKNKISNKK